MQRPLARTGFVRLLAGALLLLAGVGTWCSFLSEVWLPAFAQPHWPDSAYWVIGRLAWEGRGTLLYADPAVFIQESVRLGTHGDTFSANLPTTVLPFLPFDLLPEVPAHQVWLIFCLLCFAGAWALLLQVLRLAPLVQLVLWAVVPLFQPLVPNFAAGQVYPLVLLLLVGAAAAGAGPRPVPGESSRAARRRQVLAGLLYGGLAIVKWYYGLVLLLPVLRRRRLLLAAAAVFGAAVVITAIWWGPGVWGTAIADSLSWQTNAVTAIPAYQTVDGWLTHLLRYDAKLNPGPVLQHPDWVLPLWVGLAAILAAATGRAVVRAARRPAATPALQLLPTGLTVLLALVLAPIAIDYHFLLTLFPLAVTLAALMAEIPLLGPRWRAVVAWAVWAAAVVLLGADWQFNTPAVGGWQALLHYPRLYGALLLWGLILVLPRRAAIAPQGAQPSGAGGGQVPGV